LPENRPGSVSFAYPTEFLNGTLDPDFKFSLIEVAADAQHQHLAVPAHLSDSATQLRD
jgi:hypothetical protein